MRWPLSWLFRAAAEPPPGGDATAGPGSPDDGRGGPDGGAPAWPVDRPTGAWRGLPALRPTVSRIALTAPTEPFQRELAVNHEPEPILGHLGHDVRADGPAGFVSGFAQPLVAPADVARAARSGGPGLPVHHHARRHPAPATSPIGAPVPAEAGEPAVAEERGTAEPDEARRVLPAVESASVMAAIAATTVAPDTVVAPVRTVAPLVGRLAATAVSTGPAGVGLAATPVETAPVEPVSPARGSAPPTAPAAGRSASDAAAAAASAQPLHRSLGESRRLGLGAPVPAVPSGVRPPGVGPGRAPGRDDTVAAPAVARTTAPPRAPAAARAPVPAPARAPSASLPVLRLAPAEVSPDRGTAAEAARVSASPAVSVVETLALPALAPLVGARPLTPPAGVAPAARDLAASTEAEDADRVGTRADRLPPAASPVRPRAAAGDAVGATPAADDGGSDGSAETTVPAGSTAPVVAGRPATPSVSSAPAARPAVARLLGERPIRPAVAPLFPLAVPEEAEAEAELGAGTIPDLPLEPGSAAAAGVPPPVPSAVQRLAGTPIGDAAPGLSITGAGARPAMITGLAPEAAAGIRVGGPPVPAGASPDVRLPLPGPTVSRLPVARVAAPPASPPPPASATAAEAAAVQAILAAGSWAAADRVGVPAGPAAVQRAVEVGQVESTVEGGGQAAGGGTPAAGASEGGAAGNRDQDLDELARKLYGRIRERLGAELLADRERAGLLVDA